MKWSFKNVGDKVCSIETQLQKMDDTAHNELQKLRSEIEIVTMSLIIGIIGTAGAFMFYESAESDKQ